MVNNPKSIFNRPQGKFFKQQEIPHQNTFADELRKQSSSSTDNSLNPQVRAFPQMSFTPAPKSNTFSLLTNAAGESLLPTQAFSPFEEVEELTVSKQSTSPVKADWLTPTKMMAVVDEVASTRHKHSREGELKRELIETPNSKHKYKQMARELKDSERAGGLEDMIKLVFTQIVKVPRKIHWRVILDLADFAKRESKFTEAKYLFKLVAYL